MDECGLQMIDDAMTAWELIREALDCPNAHPANGASADHPLDARLEAARKLVQNHVAIIGDVTNTTPKTQKHLQRLGPQAVSAVDRALRTVAARLLGLPELEACVDRADGFESAAWRATAVYLDARVQSPADQCGSREPDMSAYAIAAFRSVLMEVGGIGGMGGLGGMHTVQLNRLDALDVVNSNLWIRLRAACGKGCQPEASGAVSLHEIDARQEAAFKLVTNHKAVLRDVTPDLGTNLQRPIHSSTLWPTLDLQRVLTLSLKPDLD